MLKIKGYKGITLIALIISIVVLLIMAGITISSLTGSDSAPAKANEAKQKNDIGSARDEVYLTAQNSQMEAYQTAYVENGVSAGEASKTVGNYVRTKLNEKYGTDGNFKTGLATVTATENGNIEISTTDFVIEGEIANKGGNLTWGEIEANVPGIKIINVPNTLDKNDSATLDIKRRNVSGNAKWTSDKTDIAIVNEDTGEIIGKDAGTATITASVTDNGTTYTAQCSITIVLPEQVIGQYVDLGTNILGKGTTKDWRILTKNSTGTWVILADYMPNNYKPSGESNSIIKTIGLQTSGLYKVYATYGTGRDTLLNALNFDGNQTSAATWKKLIPSETLRNKVDARGAVTGEILMSSYNEKYGANLSYSTTSTIFYNDINDISKGFDDLYVPHAESTGYSECYGYWLALPREDYDQGVYCVDYTGSPTSRRYYDNYNCIRPVVYLGSNITLTKSGSGENTVWIAQ